MFESVRAAFTLPDLRRRILFTIAMLVIYRLVSNIPVPGVELGAWLAFATGVEGSTGFLGVLNMLSGGAVQNFSVMAMGVYPYITASIIIQLLTPVVPFLEELASEGESGRNKITKYTYYLTIPLAALQAIAQVRLIGLSLPGGDVRAILPHFGLTNPADFLPTLTTILAMVAGTMFAIWLGERITEDGIGQGISLIIFGGIVAGIPGNLARVIALPDPSTRLFTLVAFVILLVSTVVVIVIVHEGQRRLPVQYGRRVRGRKVYQGQSTHVPLKVNTAGMIPIIFAQSLILLPAMLASFFISGNQGILDRMGLWMTEQFASGTTFVYWFLFFILVVGFTFFYTDVMVRQQKLPEMLQRQGGFIPGIRPGQRTTAYVMAIVRRITLVGALFLGIIAVMPGIMQFIGMVLRLPDLQQSALVVDGAGLIIVVGVVIDTMRQLESQLLMRHYESFIK